MRRALAVLTLLALLPAAQAEPNRRQPHIGYLYAAGGERGTTVRVLVGGQNLRGARAVHVSGEGVTGTVVKFLGNRLRVKNEELRELRKELARVQRERVAELLGRAVGRRDRPARRPARAGKKDTDKKGSDKKDAPAEEPASLPDHPLVEHLDDLSLRELRKVAEYFFDPNIGQQLSPQIAERLTIDLVIDKDAAPGDREIRLLTPLGLSNPMTFEVGALPEVAESEVNDFEPMELPSLSPGIVVNGQVDRRDLDRFRFRAKRGQKIVIRAEARRLVPYLPDAVPGWFQAVLELRDAKGEEVAYADDFRCDPDPVLQFEVPVDGEYDLTIRDAIYRGRDDFVYRITMGEVPFVSRIFPLGGRVGVETTADVAGMNLPGTKLTLPTSPGGPAVRDVGTERRGATSNRVLVAVDDLPECLEVEPNNTAGAAQAVTRPVIVNGRSGGPDDTDVFRFEGRAGENVVVEVRARSLGSPLDSVVELIDPAGAVVAWNDDAPDPRVGLNTHVADSRLEAELPADGSYQVVLRDAARHGGEEYPYRLRIGPPRPDFTLLITPSALNVPAGTVMPVTVHAIRADGFDGAIDLTLAGAPAGVTLDGGRVPPGEDKIVATLSCLDARPGRPVPIRIQGRARIGDRDVAHDAIPAEDEMQAFLNRHLVPARELLLALTPSRARLPRWERKDGTARLSTRGTVPVKLRGPRIPETAKLHFEISEPPPGVTLRDVVPARDGLLLVLAVDPKTVRPGSEGNLIVEVYAEVRANRRGARGAAGSQPTRYFVGVLPAIPFEVARD